jgi:hypothetical protein
VDSSPRFGEAIGGKTGLSVMVASINLLMLGWVLQFCIQKSTDLRTPGVSNAAESVSGTTSGRQAAPWRLACSPNAACENIRFEDFDAPALWLVAAAVTPHHNLRRH